MADYEHIKSSLDDEDLTSIEALDDKIQELRVKIGECQRTGTGVRDLSVWQDDLNRLEDLRSTITEAFSKCPPHIVNALKEFGYSSIDDFMTDRKEMMNEISRIQSRGKGKNKVQSLKNALAGRSELIRLVREHYCIELVDELVSHIDTQRELNFESQTSQHQVPEELLMKGMKQSTQKPEDGVLEVDHQAVDINVADSIDKAYVSHNDLMLSQTNDGNVSEELGPDSKKSIASGSTFVHKIADVVMDVSENDESAIPKGFSAHDDIEQSKRLQNSRERDRLIEKYKYVKRCKPACAESSLEILILIFRAEKLRSVETSPIVKIEGDESVESYLKLLDEQINIEKLNSIRKIRNDIMDIFNEDIDNLRSGWDSFQFFQESFLDFEKLFDSFIALFMKCLAVIRPVDVELLINCLQENVHSQHVIENRDIFLLVGGTGAGKSTLIHYLAGSNFSKVTRHNFIPKGFSPKLAKVTTSDSAKSETKGINCLSLPYGDEIYLVCDTAGLKDTEGVEIDLANGIAMTRAIRSCGSVKLILVMTSSDIGNRLEHLRDFIKSMQRFIVGLSGHVGKFYYVFNKYSDDEDVTILSSRAKELKNDLLASNRESKDFVAMLEDLEKKTKPLNSSGALNRNGCFRVDLNHPEERIHLWKSIMKLEPIENPKDVFKEFSSESSIDKLKESSHLLKNSILDCLNNYHTIDIAEFKLNQLRQLAKLTELNICETAFQSCVCQVSDYLNNVHSDVFKLMDQYFRSYENQHELSAIFDKMIYSFRLDKIRSGLAEDMVRIDSSRDIIENLIFREVKDGVRKIFDEANYRCEDDTDAKNALLFGKLNIVVANIENVRYSSMFSEEFLRKLVSLYTETKHNLQQTLNEFIGNVDRCVEETRYVDTLGSLRVIRYLMNLQAYVSENAVTYDYLESKIVDAVVHDGESLLELFEDAAGNDPQEIVSQYNETIDRIAHFVTSIKNFTHYFQEENIGKVYEIESKLLSRVSVMCAFIEDRFLELHKENSLNRFSQCFHDVDLIKRLRSKRNEQYVIESFIRLIDTLSKAILQCKEMAIGNLKELNADFSRNSKLDFRRSQLALQLQILDDASILNELEIERLHSREFDFLLESMGDFVANIQNHLANLSKYIEGNDIGKAVFQNSHQMILYQSTIPVLWSYIDVIDEISAKVSKRNIETVRKFQICFQDVHKKFQSYVNSGTEYAMKIIKSCLLSSNGVPEMSLKIGTILSNAFNFIIISSQYESRNDEIRRLKEILVTSLNDHARYSSKYVEFAGKMQTIFFNPQVNEESLKRMKELLTYSTNSLIAFKNETNEYTSAFIEPIKKMNESLTSVLSDCLIRFKTILDPNNPKKDISLPDLKLYHMICCRSETFDEFISDSVKFKDYEDITKGKISQNCDQITKLIHNYEYSKLAVDLKHFVNNDNPVVKEELKKIISELTDQWDGNLDRCGKLCTELSLASSKETIDNFFEHVTRLLTGFQERVLENLMGTSAVGERKAKLDSHVGSVITRCRKQYVDNVDVLKSFKFLEFESFYAAALYIARKLKLLAISTDLDKLKNGFELTIREEKGKACSSIMSISSLFSTPFSLAQVKEIHPRRIFESISRLDESLNNYVPPFNLLEMNDRDKMKETYEGAAESLWTFLMDEYNLIIKTIDWNITTNLSKLTKDKVSETADSTLPNSENNKPESKIINYYNSFVKGVLNFSQIKEKSENTSASKAEKQYNVMSIEDCDELLNEIDKSMSFMPNGFFVDLKHFLNTSLEQIRKLKDETRRNMDRILSIESSNSWKVVPEFIKYYENNQIFEMEKLVDIINRHLETLCSEVIKSKQEGILRIVATIKTAHDYYSMYIECLQQLERKPIQVKTKNDMRYMYFKTEFPIKLMLKIRQELLKKLQESLAASSQLNADKNIESIERCYDEVSKMVIFNPKSSIRHTNNDDEAYLFQQLFKLDPSLPDTAFSAFCHIGKELNRMGSDYIKANDVIESGLKDINMLTDDLSPYSAAVDVMSSKLYQIKISSPTISKFEIFMNRSKSDFLNLGFNEPLITELKSLKFPNYSTQYDSYNQLIEKLIDDVMEFYAHDSKTKSNNAFDRTNYYKKAAFGFNVLTFFTENQYYCSTHKVNRSDMIKHILEQVSRFSTQASDSIDKKLYAEFGMFLDNIRAISEEFKDKSILSTAKNEKIAIEKRFQVFLDLQTKEAWLSNSDWDNLNDMLIEAVEEKLIDLRIISNNISLFSALVDDKINELLDDYKKRIGGSSFLFKIAYRLQTATRAGSRSTIASELINHYKAFQGNAREIRMEKLLRASMEQLVEQSKSDLSLISQRSLIDNNKIFQDEYWNLVNTGFKESDCTAYSESLIATAKDLAIQSSISQTLKIRKLLTYIFAYWTLSNSSYYRDWLSGNQSVETNNNGRFYLLQPHAGQIFGLFRMFGIDEVEYENEPSPAKSGGMLSRISKSSPVVFTNNVCELKTGEGKSVLLAIAAIVISLLGYDVDIVCYSAYLSGRDHESFQTLFTAFSVDSNIRYGTFMQICEHFLNERCNIRDMVEEVVQSNNAVKRMNDRNHRNRVLLIDEVDVFFNQEFYCGTYTPYAQITSPEIKKLIGYIWEENKKLAANNRRLRLSQVLKSAEYQLCLKKYSNWTSFIEESTKMLLEDLFDFKDHNYYVDTKLNRIGYRVHDSISYNRVYRYKTLFAYYKASEELKITTNALNDHMYLIVDCGGFSYAKIPTRYVNIMGVTGTLKQLSNDQQRILNDEFSITKVTYIPSVYPRSNFQFDRDGSRSVIIESNAHYYSTLVNQIKEKITGNQAVFVFFETQKKLMAFLDSQEMIEYRNEARMLTEDMNAIERDHTIRQAATPKAITLLTSNFGRGTDFCTYDEKLNASGGIHVIQTYVSLQLSEEIQIQGRTARQGNNGSYGMILLDSDLELYQIDSKIIDDMNRQGNRYTRISEQRNNTFNRQYSESISHVQDIYSDHENSINFLEALYRRNYTEIKQFLDNRNYSNFVDIEQVSRTLILMDATGSMSDVLQKCTNQLNEMFRRIYDILNKTVDVTTSYKLQFAVYRNYSSKAERILECSSWESDPMNMQTFFKDRVKSSGGQGNEAIEIGLLHANRENQNNAISQIILIGDMPPNTRADVKENRDGSGGKSYWSKTAYPDEYYYEDELKKLIDAEIPIHTFFVPTFGDSAVPVFQEISKLTKGSSGRLDIESPKGADMLAGIVCSRTLFDIGERFKVKGGGKALVQAYVEKYGFVP